MTPILRRLPSSLTPRIGLAVMAAAAGASAQAPAERESDSPPYRVECPEGFDSADQTLGQSAEQTCSVDLATYIGWRVFERHCTACHAQDALGSTFAPSLVHRVRRLDRRAFYSALDNGYSGRFTDMRPWGENPEVARYYEELWSYLSARASGDLPPGPPQRLGGSAEPQDQ